MMDEALELGRRLYAIRIESGQGDHGFDIWRGAKRVVLRS
jgi:hypothetical protein